MQPSESSCPSPDQFPSYAPELFGLSGLCTDETVAFLRPDEEKQLLFDVDRILSVTSCDGETVYESGKDYVVRDGKLARTETSAIPVLPPEIYYSDGDAPLLKVRRPDGTESPCYFNGSGTMGRFQVKATYTHKPAACLLPAGSGRCGRFLRLLERGGDATVFFHGDSITYGCDASMTHRLPPSQPSFPILFVCALARAYAYSVRFVLPEAEGAYGGPFPAAPRGTKGTLTLVNTAVGGWTSENGVAALDTHIEPQIKKYGCDLFLLGYGMNDGSRPPEETAANCEAIVRRVLSLRENASVMLISTMLPNPEAIGWYANQAIQEPALITLSETLNREGVPCDVARMTSVSAAILKRKQFIDVTGNNINHPNDYLCRVYAAALLRTLTAEFPSPCRGTGTTEEAPRCC